jgi:hypothetical protein
MESLGYRKPTELLAEMVKFRPSEDHHFFAYLFLQRLPKEVRVLLARDDCKDMQALAEKVDGLMALHTHQGQEVAAIAADRSAATAAPAGAADEDDFVAAINKSGRKQQQFKKKGFKKQNQGKQRKEFESLQSPLCYYHVRFGDKAHRCDEPCAWPAENSPAGVLKSSSTPASHVECSPRRQLGLQRPPLPPAVLLSQVNFFLLLTVCQRKNFSLTRAQASASSLFLLQPANQALC